MVTPKRHVARDGTVTWRVRFRYRGTNTSETFDTQRQAEEFAKWLDALGPQGAIDRRYAEDQAPDVPTLNDVAQDHIEHLTGIEEGTRLTYTRLWARTWGPLLGEYRVDSINSDAVRRAIKELEPRYSFKSLQNQRGLLAAVLERAVEAGYLARNPSKGVRLARSREQERVEMRLITEEEFATIEDRLDPHYLPLVRFLFGTGARWGEAVALTVADVALPNVRIRRALKWSPDNRRTIGPPKTGKSNRTVVLPPPLVPVIGELCRGKASSDLVFVSKRGLAVPHRTFWSRYWLPAVAHLSPRPRIHDLRHSHASILLANRIPPHVVKERLGHEKITTTIDTYGHLMPDAQSAAAEAAAMAFTRATPLALPDPEVP